MAAIAWTDKVWCWLEDIFEYIAADDPHAASRTVQEIYEKAQLSPNFQRLDTATLPPPETSGSCYTGITESPTS